MESKKQAGWQKMAEENGLAAIFRKLEIQEVAGRYAAILDNEAELMARRASFLNMPALTGNATWEAYALRDRLAPASKSSRKLPDASKSWSPGRPPPAPRRSASSRPWMWRARKTARRCYGRSS